MAGKQNGRPLRRGGIVWLLPVLVLVELMSAHAQDVPTVPPAYWTSPPETVRWLKADPGFIRLFGDGDKHSGEPGYASEPIDYMSSRDALEWSLPAAWGLATSKGETPMVARRLHDYYDPVKVGAGRFDIESVSHMVTGRLQRNGFFPTSPSVQRLSIAISRCYPEPAWWAGRSTPKMRLRRQGT